MSHHPQPSPKARPPAHLALPPTASSLFYSPAEPFYHAPPKAPPGAPPLNLSCWRYDPPARHPHPPFEPLSLDQGYHTFGSPFKGKKHHRNSSFDRLSDELVVRILSYLPSLDLSALSAVSRRFNQLAWTPSLWRVVRLEGDHVRADRALRAILRRLAGPHAACPQIERVVVAYGAQITDKSLLAVARRCPALTHVQLAGAPISNGALHELTARCARLAHLDVTACVRIHAVSADASRRLRLTHLDLTDCVGLLDGALRQIAANCPQLTHLYLRRCAQLTDASLKCVASFCAELRELSVSDCAHVTDFGLYELGRLGAALRYLSVAKCGRVSDAGLKAIARRCYRLRYLNARGCEAVSDDAIVFLARSCTRLSALDVGKCDVSDAGLRALAECCPNLKRLSLRCCELVTDRGVECVAYYCRGLQQLNIQDCQISLEGYRAVKKYCKRCVIEHTNPGFF